MNYGKDLVVAGNTNLRGRHYTVDLLVRKLFREKLIMFSILKAVCLNELVQGGQLY